MLSQEKLQERLSGLGGSDAGTVLRLNKYRTPFELWQEKTQRVEPADLSGNQSVHFGNVLEAVVADEFHRRTGIKVQVRNQTFRHAAYPWMLANVDRVCVGLECYGVKLKAGLEIKTGSAYVTGDWGPSQTIQVDDDGLVVTGPAPIIPPSYEAQCRHYMAVLDYDTWFVCVLLGGNDFRMYELQRDHAREQEMINELDHFWNFHVAEDIPPPSINDGDVASKFPVSEDLSVEADEDTLDCVATLRDFMAAKKQIEDNISALQVTIKDRIGSADTLVDPAGGIQVTWKSSKPTKRFDGKSFKAAHPAMYDEFSVESPGSRRFVVKGA